MGKTGYSITLRREHKGQPWGIRINGGCDLGKPIVVTRAALGSPADKQLKPGDEILQIADYDARDIRHQDAQMLFRDAGNTIKVVIYRESPIIPSRDSSVEPLALPRALATLPEHQYDPIGPMIFNTALVDTSRSSSRASTHKQEVEDEQHALLEQPYRTTPLVLPGAKVKKDFGPTESYLRHHPNPKFRQAPPHPLLPHDIAMKQKVADTVLQKVVEEAGPGKQVISKQFNSPIGLYSEQNIVDSINQQTGAGVPGTPSPVLMRPNPRLSYKKTVVYDPAKSETYKALQDQELGDHIQEVTVPVTHKVFSPVKQKTPPATSASPRSAPHPVPGPQGHMNSIGHSDEIQQSYTFKRLMHMVQSEGVY
ncbi:PDZ and LIM domain protein 3 isoform X3 [Halyomorpha halys]|nr:PDZ and LIM domain protein 3 isoform X3 [Halyomorpha halys]